MSEQRIGPDGMFVNPYGTQFSERDRLAIENKRAAEVDKAVKAREASEAQAAAEREQQRREDGQKRLEAYRAVSRQRWLDNGGVETSFAAAWPSLRDTWLSNQLTREERATVEDVARLRQQPLYQV